MLHCAKVPNMIFTGRHIMHATAADSAVMSQHVAQQSIAQGVTPGFSPYYSYRYC